MKVDIQNHGHVVVLAPQGPLIADELDDLRRAITTANGAGGKRLVMDMQGIPYLDSAGVETLLEICGVHLPPLTRPRLASLSETCLEALELTDALPRLDVFDTVDNALRSCQK